MNNVHVRNDVPAHELNNIHVGNEVPVRVMKRVSTLLLGWISRAGLSPTAPDRAGA